MLESVRIRNFRVLRDLEIPELARINLVAGLNNSGKTSLIEALQLLASGGDLVSMAGATRVVESGQKVRQAMIHEDWKLMFHDLDMNSRVEISANHSSRSRLSLKFWIARAQEMEFALEAGNVSAPTDRWASDMLAASFSTDGHEVDSTMKVSDDKIQIERPEKDVGFPSIILLSYRGSSAEDAVVLGNLRQRKRHAPVERALQIMEPRLKSLESNPSLGDPIVWADIGLSELMPLAAMGEGMTRIARLIMGVCIAPGGVVLMDEIENGLHHSVMPDVWRAVDRTARKFDTQVFATTHSFECFKAAHESLEKDDFLYHRLEVEDGKNRCVTYDSEMIEAAIRHNLEVR